MASVDPGSSQDLALEAREIWLEWNKTIKESRPEDLPQPLTPEDELLKLCGVYHMADGPELIPRYVENLQAMEQTAPSFRNLQFIKVRCRVYAGQWGQDCDWYRTRLAKRNVLGILVPNGPGSTIFLTTSRTAARMAFSMQALESLWLTRPVCMPGICA